MPIEILMPALSPTMEEGNLTKWLVKEGDTVSSGDLLAEIETDKATMEVEAVEEGVLAKILVAEGTAEVKVNTPIAVLLEDDEDASVMDGYVAGGGSAPKASDAPSAPQGGTSPTSGGGQESDNSGPPPSSGEVGAKHSEGADPSSRIKASPLAKRLAKDAGIDLASVKGTGPNGRILKADIESFDASKAAPKAAAKSEAPAAKADPNAGTDVGPSRGDGASYLEKLGVTPGSYDLVPLDGMRRVIAKRLVSSNQDVPDFPLVIDCEIDELLAMRKQLNAQAPEGVKVSVNDMLIRASALALKHFPDANASYTPDGIAYHKHADVAVAVAIDGGLITPIVREAENKGLSTISTEMKDLAGRAREKKLKPQEYQGGTFSISNLGMFGIKEFGSIINEPHGMILSVGAGAPRPVVKDGALAVATVMTVTLTCDHRVVDGAIGAQWLQVFKRFVEQPITMML